MTAPRRLTFGEIIRDGILRYAEQEKIDPYEVKINTTDICLLDEIADGTPIWRDGEHPRNRHARMVAGMRRSPLWECWGHVSYPGFRGFHNIAVWQLKQEAQNETD